MEIVFEVIDKIGKKIRMTRKQWIHVMERRSYMEKYLEEIKETLQNPDKLEKKLLKKGYYYKNYKFLKSPNKFILVIVKYLNGEGFVITTYLEK